MIMTAHVCGRLPNRGSPPAILLRESYREAGKTKNRTLANLSRWPAERIEQLRAVLRGDKLLPAAEAVEIVRALPHGHVLAALGTARRLALDTLLPRRAPQRRRDLALALIVARLLEPAAKLATARMLDSATATHSLGEMRRPHTCAVMIIWRLSCQLKIGRRHDRKHDEYQVFSAASVRKWSKFGLVQQRRNPDRASGS